MRERSPRPNSLSLLIKWQILRSAQDDITRMILNLINKKFLYGFLALGFSMLACEPVIAIGRYELLCLLVLILVLLGPPIYRFVRWLEKYLSQKDK